VARLNAAANRAMESAPIRERLASEALRAISGPPDLLRQQMVRDTAQWRGIIKEKGITLD